MSKQALLIEPNGSITISTLDEITRSLLTFAEVVYMYTTMKVDASTDPVVQSHVRATIGELIERGLVRCYSYEWDRPEVVNRSARVITAAEHTELYDAVVGKIKSNPLPYTDSLPDPERTSRIVERRIDLWRLGLATLLGADLSLSGVRAPGGGHIAAELSQLCVKSDLTSKLFDAFGVQSLAHLGAEDIIEFRRRGRNFREQIGILTETVKSRPGADVTDIVQREYRGHIEALHKLAQGAVGNRAVRKLTRSALMNVVGLVFSPITALMCGLDLYDYMRQRNKYQFVLYFHTLRKPR